MPSSSVSKYPAGHPRRVKSRDRESLDRLEQMGSANPPLAIYCLHDDRRLQLRLYGIRETSGLDSLFATASSFLHVVHRSVYVRVAVCRQMARAPNRRIKHNCHRDEEESPLEENEIGYLRKSVRCYGLKPAAAPLACGGEYPADDRSWHQA
jgi:hypothetical protein